MYLAIGVAVVMVVHQISKKNLQSEDKALAIGKRGTATRATGCQCRHTEHGYITIQNCGAKDCSTCCDQMGLDPIRSTY